MYQSNTGHTNALIIFEIDGPSDCLNICIAHTYKQKYFF